MRSISYISHTTIIFISTYVIVNFWPNYKDNELPLFTDIITGLIFLPCFFMLFAGFPSLIFMKLNKSPLKRLAFILVNIVTIISIVSHIIPFGVKGALFASIIPLAITYLYINVTLLIKKHVDMSKM